MLQQSLYFLIEYLIIICEHTLYLSFTIMVQTIHVYKYVYKVYSKEMYRDTLKIKRT